MPLDIAAKPTRYSQHLRRAAVGLMRVVALVLAAKLSGGMHAALDVIVATGAVAHPQDDCERDGHECPPGCPSCHCTHAPAACSAPAPCWPEAEPEAHARSVEPAPYAESIPPRRARGRLDRPPRRTSLA